MTRAGWPGAMDWTVSMVCCSPPPKTTNAPLTTAPAASWVAWPSVPIEVPRPVAGSTRMTPAELPPDAGSPPSSTTLSPSTRATTRDTGAGSDGPVPTVITRSAGAAVVGAELGAEAGFELVAVAGLAVWWPPRQDVASSDAATHRIGAARIRLEVTRAEATTPTRRRGLRSAAGQRPAGRVETVTVALTATEAGP